MRRTIRWSDVDFAAAVDGELSGYLGAEGFTGPEPRPFQGLRFTSGLLVLDVGLSHPREYRRFVEVYLGRLDGAGPDRDCVAVEELLPHGSPAREEDWWEYTDQSSVAAVVGRLRDLVLRSHAAVYWRDPQLLHDVLDRLRRKREEQDAQWRARDEREAPVRHLENARTYYLRRRFADAVEEFALAGPLGRADQAKLEIARRRVAREERDHA